MKTKFLNIDLDLFNLDPEDTKKVLEIWGDRVVEMYNGPTEKGHLLSLELTYNSSDLSEIIGKWILLFSDLRPIFGSKPLSYATKILNVGIQAGTEHSTLFCVSSELLNSISYYDTDLTFTIYGYQEEDS